MSFSLYFKPRRNHKKTIARYADWEDCGFVGFGFQTPTAMTMQCMNLPPTKVIEFARSYMEAHDWDPERITEIVEHLNACFNDPAIELIYL